jgi:hypothetical protein
MLVSIGAVSGLPRILLCPFLSRGDGLGLVFFPCLGDIVGERVVWVWRAEESLDGEEDGADLEGRRPVAYLVSRARQATTEADSLLRTSRQMRPSLSMLGW